MISAPDISFGSGSKPTLAFVFVIFVLLPILIGLGCDNKSSTEQNQEATFVANDTIRNLPIPAQVKAVNPDSLAKPKTVPLLREPKVVPARSNLFTAPPPTVLPGPANLTIVTPGENGIPLPDTISMVKEEGIIRHPGPAPAGPLGMKPEAITDIRYLSVSQGLMGTFVSDIIEDRNGNLWFIGEEYLSRYDGKSLIHYTPKDGFGLDEFGFLMEDSRGNLWLGGSGRICRYNGRHVTRFIMEGEFKYAAVISMMEDQGGNLWFGTRQGVIKYEPSANSGQGSFVKYTIREGLIHRVVHSMLEDRRGRLWFGTGFGLSCYDGKRFTNYAIEEDLDVRSMLEDRQGVFWLGTDLGLIRFDPSANAGPGIFAKINVEMGNRIEALTEDRNGNIWVASYRDGLFCLIRDENGVGKKYLRYTEREGLSGNYFRSMLMDSHGNIWIGGQNGGATRINNRNPIRYINQETGLKGNNVDCIFEDSHGYLWFGLASVGAIKYDTANGGRFTNYSPAEGLGVDDVTSFMEDRQGNLWMGSWGGVTGIGASRMNVSAGHDLPYKSFTHFNVATGLYHQNVISMLQDSRGKLWFGNRGGVTYYEPDYFSSHAGLFFHYPLKGERNIAIDLLEDSNGDVWICTGGFGTRGEGVYKFDFNHSKNRKDSTSFTIYTSKDGLGGDAVRDMLQDSQGILWFATENGLSRFDPAKEHFYTYRTKDGLQSDRLMAMAEDRQNNLWILSQSGVDVAVPNGNGSSAIPEANDYHIFSFDAYDGFTTVDGGFKNILVTRQNELWWATGDGVASLDLNRFELPADTPKVRLNFIEIDQKYVDFSSFLDTGYRESDPLMDQIAGTFDSVAAFYNYPLHLKLPYDLNHLTFHYSAIDWTSPHQLQYSYLMEGLDKTWSEVSSEIKADYRNLPFGHYTFKVKAIGAANKWSETFEYPFRVLPPWWQSWWAYCIYALIFVFGIFIIDRYQRKRLLDKAHAEAREKELEQAREIEKAYHELKSTQSQLIQSEKMASLGELTAGIAHEIQNPLNFVNNFSDVNKELAAELLEEIRKGNGQEAEAIINDIMNNDEKILHHGRRAEAIVKSMLQHSRGSSGKKEPTDINALADEYLRLAYHGMRARDKTFNASMETDFDDSIGDLNIVPQEIGRVLLNLITNAFYAVAEKQKQDGTDYQPNVSLSTKRQGDRVEIRVKDNGTGIPQKVLDKIFQPFFSTKPTGEGTGLGLSLSYDIVKVHGGELRVETKEGIGSNFIISIPTS